MGKRLKHERHRHDAGLFVLGSFDLFLDCGLLVQLFFLDDFSEEVILIIVIRCRRWLSTLELVDSTSARSTEDGGGALDRLRSDRLLLGLPEFHFVISQDLVNDGLVDALVVDQRVFDLSEHLEPLSLERSLVDGPTIRRLGSRTDRSHVFFALCHRAVRETFTAFSGGSDNTTGPVRRNFFGTCRVVLQLRQELSWLVEWVNRDAEAIVKELGDDTGK